MSIQDFASALTNIATVIITPMPTVDTINAGSTVRNQDGKIGTVKFIDLSPYWAEEIQGVLRAYVEFKDFTDYLLESEIVAVWN